MLAMLLPENLVNGRRRKDNRALLGVVAVACVLLVLLYQYSSHSFFTRAISYTKTSGQCLALDYYHMHSIKRCEYNSKRSATTIKGTVDGEGHVTFRIAVVADLDEERSKDPNKPNTWQSYLKYGILTQLSRDRFSVEWDADKTVLKSTISEKGRGLELSELVLYNDKLYTVDDRTGIVYQITRKGAVPWLILTDGDGSVAKGFKGEWMTVKDQTLYVGGLGKEWTTPTGAVLNQNPQYVKSIGPLGEVRHHNWAHVYNDIKEALGIKAPGYVIHEAVCWSPIHKRWYFLPRRASHEMYDDQADERRATNVLISCNEKFKDFKVTSVGKISPTHGFSSFKFIPGTDDHLIVALKSMEDQGKISTFIVVFDIMGNILMDEHKVADNKYEGIEFV